MDICRKIGALVFMGVPVIVGGGIVFDIFAGSFTALIIYEILLAIFAGAILSK